MSPASVAVDPFALRPGARLGKYTIVRRLAVGGMAELYLARVRGLRGFDKVCALKRPRPVLATDREFVDSLLIEARIAGRLDHPNVAHVSDVGQVDNEYFFVMEFVHGHDLRKILSVAEAGRTLPLACALEIVAGVARGLHHAHECLGSNGRALGIVHRDVSPSNVLVSFSGDVKVVDFGIAKALDDTRHTRTGTLKGKIGYMSPEQCAGETVDRRTDVFGLGILLYEATTRVRLFRAESEFAVLNKIMTGRFRRPSTVAPGYPPALEAVVMRALAVDRDQRFPTAEAFVRELETVRECLDLRCSSLALADMMRDMFGAPPHPASELPDAEEPAEDGTTGGVQPMIDEGAPTRVVAGERSARWGGALAIAAATTLAAGLIVGWIGAKWSGTEPDTSVVGDVESSRPVAAPTQVEMPPPEAVVVSAPAAIAVPVPPAIEAPVPEAVAPSTAAVPPSPAKSRRRPARSRAPAKSTDAAPPTRIFPDAYYERRP